MYRMHPQMLLKKKIILTAKIIQSHDYSPWLEFMCSDNCHAKFMYNDNIVFCLLHSVACDQVPCTRWGHRLNRDYIYSDTDKGLMRLPMVFHYSLLIAWNFIWHVICMCAHASHWWTHLWGQWLLLVLATLVYQSWRTHKIQLHGSLYYNLVLLLYRPLPPGSSMSDRWWGHKGQLSPLSQWWMICRPHVWIWL